MDNNNTMNRPAMPQKNQQADAMSLREMFDFVWRLRYWIAASAFVFLCLGFLYTRMQTKMYERTAWIMLNNNDGTSNEMAMLSEMTGGRTVAKKIDNEVFILKTPSMSAKVVEELGLNYRYYRYGRAIADGKLASGKGPLSTKLYEYYKNSPYTLYVHNDELLPANMRVNSISIDIRHKGANDFVVRQMTVNGKEYKFTKEVQHYGDSLVVGSSVVCINLDSESDEALLEGGKYLCSWTTPENAAKYFQDILSVNVQGAKTQRSDVIELKMTDAIIARAEDFINTLAITANNEARQYANQASVNTINFIDQRLGAIAKDLDEVESEYRNYQSTRALADLSQQSSATISADQQYQNRLNEVDLQLSILSMISEYISTDAQGDHKVVPANLGLSDAGLNSTLTSYNTLISERNRMLANSSESNPRVVNANAQLDEMRRGILVSIENLNRVYRITRQEVAKSLSVSRSKMSSIPEQQFELQQIGRKREIIEPLYLLLQQKREETQIKMYSEIDNFRILESAFGSSTPISPSTSKIMLMALILGCALPVGLVWLRMQLKNKVETKEDVTKVLSTPVLATIPKADSEKGVLITSSGRDAVAESFRMLRSNLKYVKDVKVIQVTSSVPGEGKSFVSSNLALSLSHLNKRVVVVGMDIRKPALGKFFTDIKQDNTNSVVGYLIGKCTNLADLPKKSSQYPGLDIILAGPVPPNPTEILDQDNLGTLIEWLRSNYDYVVIDSAPYIPVPDSAIINKYVDTTLYVLRAEHTELATLQAIKEVMNSQTAPIKLPNLIINDFNLESTKYRYGYGKGYGYGYGYGKGYGYGYGYGKESDKETSSEK